MRLSIDWTRCDGHGLCAALLGDRIGRDEWGFPVLPSGDIRADPEVLTEVVHACPALALRLVRNERTERPTPTSGARR